MTEEEVRAAAIKSCEKDLAIIRAKLDKMEVNLHSKDDELAKKSMCEIAFLEHFIDKHLESVTALSLHAYNKSKSANEGIN